jgi:hypothetical protein
MAQMHDGRPRGQRNEVALAKPTQTGYLNILSSKEASDRICVVRS